MNDITASTPAPLLTRRQLFGTAIMAGGLAILPPLRSAAEAREIPATPDAALQALIDGNKRFAAGQPLARHRDLARVKELAPKQSPFAAVLGCADSRVPVELVFDQGFGDVFVCRAAGNVATPELLASLEFGTHVLGARVLLVLGHTGCGAVVAASSRTAAPGQISALYQHLRPAVDRAGGQPEKAIVENVRIQTKLVAESSPVLAQLIGDGKLKVVGGVYDLGTGTVSLV